MDYAWNGPGATGTHEDRISVADDDAGRRVRRQEAVMPTGEITTRVETEGNFYPEALASQRHGGGCGDAVEPAAMVSQRPDAGVHTDLASDKTDRVVSMLAALEQVVMTICEVRCVYLFFFSK